MKEIIPVGDMSFVEQMWFIVTNYPELILEGIKNTLMISIVGTIFGVFLGALISTMKSSEVHYKDNLITKVTKKISIYFASGYIHLFRGTPMIVQSMIFFYGFASLGFKMNIIFAGIVIVSFNSAAYIAEIIRGGIEALDKGQYEAARSLGMTRRLAMLKVILPQSLKNSIPSLMNELIVNVKDTSVLSVIGVGELFYMSRGAASEYGLYLQAMVVAAIVYLILTMSLSKLFNFYLSKSDEKFAIASVSSPEVHS